jgi:hypothetical protein
MTISYPYLWVGISAYPASLPRSWVEWRVRSLRIGEIQYCFGLKTWSSLNWRQEYRRLRGPGCKRIAKVAKAIVRWKLHDQRFWKKCRFVLNFPSVGAWLHGHFRRWANHPKELQGLMQIEGVK